MKKIYRNIVLLILPLILLIVVVPVNKRLKYLGLKDDCFNHGIWIYDRLYNNKKAVDIAFIGSSHTINGINDKIISQQLEKYQTQVANFGYCRLGRNLHYTLIKEIINNKKPGSIFIEVREDENRYSHPIAPYIAETKDVIFARPFFNRDLLNDIYDHLSYKVELMQDILFNNTNEYPIQNQDYGFASSPDTASGLIFREEILKEFVPKSKRDNLERDFYMKYPRAYLNSIHRLCRDQNIKLVFIYLRTYGSEMDKPREYQFYSNLGEILIPPLEIFQDPSNWHDQEHLNQAGAKKLSLWLANKIESKFN